jgi:hypothetical protein
MLQSSKVSSSCFNKWLSSLTYFCSIMIFFLKKALSSHLVSNSELNSTVKSEGTVRITPLAEELGGLYF